LGLHFQNKPILNVDPTQNHFEMVCTSPMACIKSSTSTYEQKIQKTKGNESALFTCIKNNGVTWQIT
jgi:hypothetical protein